MQVRFGQFNKIVWIDGKVKSEYFTFSMLTLLTYVVLSTSAAVRQQMTFHYIERDSSGFRCLVVCLSPCLCYVVRLFFVRYLVIGWFCWWLKIDWNFMWRYFYHNHKISIPLFTILSNAHVQCTFYFVWHRIIISVLLKRLCDLDCISICRYNGSILNDTLRFDIPLLWHFSSPLIVFDRFI